jgi:hypothetical protein
MSRTSTFDPLVKKSPIYWFALMEGAKDEGDFDTAARAKREREQLGVLVTYRPRGRPQSSQKGGGGRVA